LSKLIEGRVTAATFERVWQSGVREAADDGYRQDREKEPGRSKKSRHRGGAHLTRLPILDLARVVALSLTPESYNPAKLLAALS